jgi:prepilin-type processing-associated H-X9-DG protein
LVVIAIIAILAAMVLPAFSHTKSKVGSIVCENNLKQLQLGWHQYAADYCDALPANKWKTVNWQDDCPEGYQNSADSWVLGDSKVDKDTWGIRNGSLFYYIGATGSYRCPADFSAVDGRRQMLRKRSYSMSYYMNGSVYMPERMTKLSQVHPPSKVFVFLDEHQDSINDGVFYVHPPHDVGERVAGPHWMDLPAQRHDGGCNFSFADGHIAHWKWRWSKRLLPGTLVMSQNDLADLRQLQTGVPTP